MGRARKRGKVDLIVIPDFLVHPGLIERIKGYSLKTLLDNTAIPVLVYQSGDTAWLRTNSRRVPVPGGERMALQAGGHGGIAMNAPAGA
jgi:hypothetical protein